MSNLYAEMIGFKKNAVLYF